MSKSELFENYLREEGYVPKIDDDGDVIFKKEGLTFILFGAEDDPEFFRIALPNFWEIESEEERQRVMTAAAVVNANVKVVKIFPVRDNVWASVEQFVSPIENFAAVFERSIRVLMAGVDQFRKAMRNEAH